LGEKVKKVITCRPIKIQGSIPRDKIVKKVVDRFIKTEYGQKGKGITFRYPVERLPNKKRLYISRPGHKKNFDFKVEVTEEMVLEEGKHDQIALCLRDMKHDNPRKFKILLQAIETLFQCEENDVDKLVENNSTLRHPSKRGVIPETVLKILKWMFIMEDIVYWDVEGRAFLYNY
jgi:hypothetical protein